MFLKCQGREYTIIISHTFFVFYEYLNFIPCFTYSSKNNVISSHIITIWITLQYDKSDNIFQNFVITLSQTT